jgi:hypothetical protein
MPSIFIWKSDKVPTSKKTIRVYSGSNWILEDNDYSSKSYKLVEQTVIPGFNDSVITFNIISMPQDWIGTELLEVTQVSYELIKTDNYGTLEQIGNWMRFTSSAEIVFEKENLEAELNKITNWMNTKKEHKTVTYNNPKPTYNQEQRTYNKPQYNNKQRSNIPHNKQRHTNNPNPLDTNFIQEQFKNFLIKFDINNINHNILSSQSMAV